MTTNVWGMKGKHFGTFFIDLDKEKNEAIIYLYENKGKYYVNLMGSDPLVFNGVDACDVASKVIHDQVWAYDMIPDGYQLVVEVVHPVFEDDGKEGRLRPVNTNMRVEKLEEWVKVLLDEGKTPEQLIIKVNGKGNFSLFAKET